MGHSMKKHLILFFLILHISLSAQNFIIGGKFTSPFNENFKNFYAFETLISTNNNAYSIGAFFGSATIDFNINGYEWVHGVDDATKKNIYGFISYIYPLHQINNKIFNPLFLLFTWAHIDDYPSSAPAMPGISAESGCHYPNSRNDDIWIISLGYKINMKFINLLLGMDYQHREYDLKFDEYDNNHNYIKRYSVHQIEKSFQINVTLQYVF